MKNIPVVLSSLLLSCTLLLSACTNTANKTATPAAVPVSSSGIVSGSGKIAYVNVDSLETQCTLFSTKREEFKQRQVAMENELQRSYDAMQTEADRVQKKAQANTLTQSEYEAAQKSLGQMQRSLETRKQSLTEQLIKEQTDFNKFFKDKLDAFLAEYNKTKQYDYILSYSAAGSSILYVNKSLEITKDVVDGMNAATKNDSGKKNK